MGVVTRVLFMALVFHMSSVVGLIGPRRVRAVGVSVNHLVFMRLCAGVPRMLTPAEVAQSLGVTEADVLASLESGDLKGKKIGSAWRISSAALEEFLKA